MELFYLNDSYYLQAIIDIIIIDIY